MTDDETYFSDDEINEEEEYQHSSQWKLTQWFRKMEEEADVEFQNHDHISALQFSDTGKFLATGDHSGNVVILENDGPGKNGAPAHFAFFTEFQSHYLDHDFSKADELFPKIHDLKFGPMTNDSVYLLVTSAFEMKLWKVTPQLQYTIVDWNIPTQPLDDRAVFSDPERGNAFRPQPLALMSESRATPIVKKLRVPKRAVEEVETVPILRKTYTRSLHTQEIVGIDVTEDNTSFLSADMISVNLWDFNISDTCYKVVEVPSIETEYVYLITNVFAHPSQASQFLYTTSNGNINICDMRLKALADHPVNMFSHADESQSVYEELEDSLWEIEQASLCVSDAKFSKGGKFVISRDYMTIRIWDVAMPSQPVETIYVHECLRDSLIDLKDANYIYDGFKLGLSAKGNVVTGSYGNHFHVLDFAAKKDTFIKAGTSQHKVVGLEGLRTKIGEDTEDVEPEYGMIGSRWGNESNNPQDRVGYPHNLAVDHIDFTSKILNCAWHPDTETVALTGENNVFVYGKFGKKE